MKGDAGKLRKILDILLENAIRYSGEKTEILLDARRKEDMLEVSVSDNGIGVEKKNKEAIFERFFRGDEAKKISPDGLGVNLFIAREFARGHGGSLECVDVKKKEGSKFVLLIPLNS